MTVLVFGEQMWGERRKTRKMEKYEWSAATEPAAIALFDMTLV
ncbi:MAG: hypothetical protein JW395_2193 [Nitrospira sp.]|nr:hypothetical protein [Nitrospira sp.]